MYESIYKGLLIINLGLLILTCFLYIRNLFYYIPFTKGLKELRGIFTLASIFGLALTSLSVHLNIDWIVNRHYELISFNYLWLYLLKDLLMAIFLLVCAETIRLFILFYSPDHSSLDVYLQLSTNKRGDYQVEQSDVRRKE